MLGKFKELFSKKEPLATPPLFLFNTLSGEREEFIPISPREVKMYNCGPTVYSRQHIGNLRAYVFADMIRRALTSKGYGVKQVINITDVGHLVSDADEGEDKMEKSARQSGKSAQEIAAEFTLAFFDDLDLLGIDREKIEFPRATDYINEQIVLVRTLEEKGYTYVGKKGVYFDVSRFPSYGKLGGVRLSGLKEGARIEKDPDKRGPYDFFLWKFPAKGEVRQQEWDSPWGRGFPGWHIECTAMIFKLLGKQIDIHTGGVDHIPVHHNNEIAQAESATGKTYVRYWMHNEHVMIENKKISKSIGNTIYLHNLADRGFSPMALRYWFLTSHYRTQLNFTWEAIEGANTALSRLKRLLFEDLPENGGAPDPAFMKDVTAALMDDLDTPRMIARIWELVKDESVAPAAKRASLLWADDLLGLGFSAPRESAKLSVGEEAAVPEEVLKLKAEREAARANKDFVTADSLRDQIEALGYEVKDTPDGSEITRKESRQ